LLLFIISIIGTGCTAVGVLTGLAIDTREAKSFTVKEKIEIDKGKEIEVVTYQGETLRGVFQDTITIQNISYKESFERANRALPDIFLDSATISISLEDGKKRQGTFLRFYPGLIRLNIIQAGQVYSSVISFEKVKSISISGGTGDSISADTLRSWIHQGLIPSPQGIIINNDSGRLVIPLLKLKSIIEVKSQTYYTLALGLIGFVIDVYSFASSFQIKGAGGFL